MKWHCEPKSWKLGKGQLNVTVDKGTDFWRITHYDFIRDNGHFYFEEVEGDFEASVKITGQYNELYDQAGLMIRQNEKNWIKAGIEFVNGIQNLSTVVTRKFSDWSLMPGIDNTESIWLKLIRKNDFVEIKYSFNNRLFKTMRLAYFPPAVRVKVGVMAAAPDGNGFQVRFSNFMIRPEL